MIFDESGTLAVRTYTAGGALPIKNSTVRIQGVDEENRFVEYTLTTDVDGLTEIIALPAPARTYSLAPNSAEIPYASYNVEVSADGYYTKRISDIAIFSGVGSFQPISMIPLPVRSDVPYPRGNLDATVVENEYLEESEVKQ